MTAAASLAHNLSENLMPPDPTQTAATPNRRTVALVGAALLVAAIVVIAVGVTARRSQAARLGELAQAQAVRSVTVISPKSAGESAALDLPARIEAWSRAPIYSRVGGYLKSWKADIGTPVKAGQLLAEIETPELDQQLLQAQAELATTKANTALAEATAKRWQELLASGMVTRQNVEEKTGDLTAKQSVTRAMQANVERFETLKRFTRIVAPFDGVVTARNTDVGALIGVGGVAGSELFVVSDTRKLRVYVTLPQILVGAVRMGATARLTVPERPGKHYVATVQSMAQSISGSSGGMLVQLGADNMDGELLTGGFANIALEVPRNAGMLTIPPSALIFDKAGLQVATVGDDDKVVLKPVKIARDLGTSLELASGLTPQDRVIESPPDGVGNGDTVRVANAEGKAGKRAPGVGALPAPRSQAP
jgi:membrane fusion protein, multidrug efflux system